MTVPHPLPNEKVMLAHLDHAKAGEVAAVLWGFAKLGIPQAPGSVFLEAVCDNLQWTLDQYGNQVGATYEFEFPNRTGRERRK